MTHLGPWELIERIAEGGSGVVWCARRDGRMVALKTLRKARAADRESFRREARALSRVRHPGVVAIVDHGEHEGTLWLAMDKVQGTPLGGGPRRDTTKAPTWSFETPDPDHTPAPRARRDPDVGLALFRQVCAALEGLHGQGLVHRDLKPDNVLVTDAGRVVLVDLGLATSARGGRDSIEAGGQHAGTVAYLSPEQARGEVVDSRTDIYALGCMLYEWWVGVPPFIGPVRGVLRAHATQEVLLPASILPPALGDLVLSMLSKDPRARPRITAVAEVLEQLGAPVLPAVRGLPSLFRAELVGRGRVMRQLRSQLREVHAGEGRAVQIRGPAGVGKTRLGLEVLSAARSLGFQLWTGEFLSGGSPPYAALAGLFESLLDAARQDPEGMRAAVRGPACLSAAAPDLAEIVGTPIVDSPRIEGLDEALTDALAWLTRERPAVLFIDDLQWADPATLRWLMGLTLAPLPRLFLLTTSRPEGPELGAQTLELDVLDTADNQRLAADLLGVSELPDAMASCVGDQTPQHTAEWVRACVLERVVEWGTSRWRSTNPERGAALAGLSWNALLAVRIAHLPEDARPVLVGAAILGRTLDARVLATLLEQPIEHVLDAMAVLERHWILVDTPHGIRFAQGSLPERVIAGLDDDQRRALHQRAAIACIDAPAEVRAVHLEAAGRKTEASEAWFQAARQAMSSWARESAEAAIERSMQLGHRDTRAERLAWWAVQLRTGGRSQEAEVLVTAMLEEPGIEPSIRGRLWVALAQVAVSERGRDSAASHARKALDLAEAYGDRELEADAARMLCQLAMFRGGEAEETLSLARRMARAYQECTPPMFAGHVTLALALRGAKRSREAYQVLLDALPHLRAQNSPTLASALNTLGGSQLMLGRHDEAVATLEEARAIHIASGNRVDLGYTLHDLAQVHLELGADEQALELSIASSATFDTAGLPNRAALVRIAEFEALRRLGTPDVAATGRLILQQMQETGSTRFQAALCFALGGLAIEHEKVEEASRWLRDGRSCPMDPHAETEGWLLETAVHRQAGRPEEAERALEHARRLSAEIDDRGLSAAVDRASGL